MSQAAYQYPGGWDHGDPRIPPGDPLISPDFNAWWRRGFAVVRRGWRPLALVQVITAVPALALLIPAQVISDLASRRLAEQATGTAMPAFGDYFAASGITMVLVLLAGGVYLIGSLITVRLVVSIATGADAGAGRALRSALPRVPALAGWYLLAGLIIFGALLACILPVFYVAAVFMVLPVVVTFERGNAISRCFSLFHHELGVAVGRVATVFALGLGLSLVFLAISSLVSLAVGGSVFPEANPGLSETVTITDSVIRTTLSALSGVIGGVVLTPLTVATYADLRARREPFRTADLPA